ncbi:unnamed protein product [Acanthoscelides obtectus]|uniref:Uncharacterized protein n=1 Tax=Acanthoscelides obtectus TaxID=200917 RepID=A0A9P0KD90_ACAOB|nr:unnamed protein product [Acanthoscelides obtectus]CAK1654278.1 hypothetical protein AOBTE_LOCUS18503 [Acanthoscelides obtectus]
MSTDRNHTQPSPPTTGIRRRRDARVSTAPASALRRPSVRHSQAFRSCTLTKTVG